MYVKLNIEDSIAVRINEIPNRKQKPFQDTPYTDVSNQPLLQKQEKRLSRPWRRWINKNKIASLVRKILHNKKVSQDNIRGSESNYDSVSFLHSFFWDFTEIFWRWYLNDNTLTIFELQKQAEVDILQQHWKHFCGTLVSYHRQMTSEYWQIRQKQWTSSQIHPFL